MKRFLIPLAAVSALVLFEGCSHSRLSFDPKPEDRLAEKEKFALFDYVRGFVLSSKRLKLSQEERKTIQSTDPEIRIFYTAPKEGRMHMYWELPRERRLIAFTEGPLQTPRNPSNWRISIVTGKRNANAGMPKDYGMGK